MQSTRPIFAAKTPITQAQRRDERQLKERDQQKPSTPSPLNEEQLERVGGGYSAPKGSW